MLETIGSHPDYPVVTGFGYLDHHGRLYPHSVGHRGLVILLRFIRR